MTASRHTTASPGGERDPRGTAWAAWGGGGLNATPRSSVQVQGVGAEGQAGSLSSTRQHRRGPPAPGLTAQPSRVLSEI